MEPVLNDKGEYVIPASRRPDGTWRKEVVVKKGYVPQEEVQTYQTRVSKPKGIPGLAPAEQKPKATGSNSNQRPKQQNPSITTKVLSDGNAKKASSLSPAPSSSSNAVTISTTASVDNSAAQVETVFKNLSVAEKALDSEVDKEKKLKALKKKLRDIVEIEKKPTESLTPEQREKLGRKSAIETEIAELEKTP